ncbi:MAG TPA: hypothetical protein VK821_15255 [Dehalococcoidia bacterium]|nr:hypothetical protein [Dehalococcoidia bacterium]
MMEQRFNQFVEKLIGNFKASLRRSPWLWAVVALLLVLLAIRGAASKGNDTATPAASTAAIQAPQAKQYPTPPAAAVESSPSALPTQVATPVVTTAPQPPRPAPTAKPVTSYTLRAPGTFVSQSLALDKGFTTFHFSYQGGSNFIVKLLDSQGSDLELLVNTIGAYEGVTAISMDKSGPYVLSVEARAPWAAEVAQPIIDSQPGAKSANGTGDGIVYLSLPSGLRRLHLTNAGRSNFIAYIYNGAGERKLLVNEIGGYDGTVAQSISGKGGTFAIVVRSSGTWTVVAQ